MSAPLDAARAAAASAPGPAPGSWAAHLRVALTEVDRLSELLAARRAPLSDPSGVRLKDDEAWAKKEALRAAAETGCTDYAPFVGRVLCPAREKCPAGLVSVFSPLADGRLPMHRDSFNAPCPGAHKKPVTPPLKLRPPTSDTENHNQP
ncbi:hypothetical protein [Kitasatospora sp. NPDC088134]|uniref:hypothetical protein n=1 Tax=Kitasatospora sp. NPDC088134 TaxID=3364071 RepID=UPI00380770EF